jgi:hypothetical protein
MAKFNGFFDNLGDGVLNPKGNLADWQHASRLYTVDGQKFAPKTKFTYHVTFYLTNQAKSVIPELATYVNEIGILVKSADLPGFSAVVETKNKYNRKKNVQTALEYQPISIEFHDDNYGATTALLEAYYRYYFADGNQSLQTGAYGNRVSGDTLYKGPGDNEYQFGMDNNIPVVPFFDRIEISQMARKSYTKYTLVNPIIQSWEHDSVDNSDGATPMSNAVTIAYDTVFYDRGAVEAGNNGDPTGFGTPDHYDTTPSPLTLAGGGTSDVASLLGGAIDLYGYIAKGENFSNPLEAAITGINLFENARDLSSEGLREQGFNLVTDTLGNIARTDVSGLAGAFFPKNSGDGGSESNSVTEASPSIQQTPTTPNASLSLETSQSDIDRLAERELALQAEQRREQEQLIDLGFQNYFTDEQRRSGSGGLNNIRSDYNDLSLEEKIASYDTTTLPTGEVIANTNSN